ncbi:DNA polymerase III subunit alpha [Candidatus Saccharibacteria bacterium]|nr:DNA polymerase III subunit alpha [Candidatus Saccharibacteria bacterium]
MEGNKTGATKVGQAATLTPADFVHLHNHTHHSLLDGLTKIDELVAAVKDMGMEAVAATDHGTMSGLLELYKTANDAGIKPILGAELYMAARKHTDKDPNKDKERHHITLLAMNNTGYKNLSKLSTEANLNGFYYKPRIDHDLLKQYNEGIICLSGCTGSEISSKLADDDYEAAKQLTQWHHKVFGDRFYLEMQDHGHPDAPLSNPRQQKINEGLAKLSRELDIPLVVTCDAHYLRKEDQDVHEILLCVGTGAHLNDTNRMTLKDFELYVIDPRDIIKRWGKDFPDAIRNTKKIADRCNVTFDLGKTLIPKFDVPKGETEKSYLDQLVYRGFAVRYGGKTASEAEKLSNAAIRKILSKEVLSRFDMEAAVIDRMQYNGYFLIVQDFINWGKSRGIVFGPGRGSAAGSIMAYALNITDIDPLKYDLLFERFLNPERISMPDIDIDIQDSRRDEVIEYCANKYGQSRVTNIGTFGKMMAKNAVRDVARVLEVPYSEADALAKLVPDPVQGRHVPLEKAIQENPDLSKAYDTDPTAKQILDYAKRLDGTIRSHGVHACGVVIAPNDLVEYLPLEMAQKGVVATQFPCTQVEDLGLLKMDFLGLSNLTVINNTLRIVKKVTGLQLNIYEIPLDDKKTFKLFQRGDTTGVFQLESAGMKRYLRDLKPTVFEDIVAMVALYRPGPLTAGIADSFVARKNGREKISYDHKLMEPALKSTYGAMVYQEQFMRIVRDMCGFTGGEADTLRKAVGKKKRDLMAKMKDKVIAGAVKNNVDKKIAEKFWHDLEGFADYAFNKSHAACYAQIAYWTAYLKAQYPDAFMAAVMTSDAGNTDRLTIEMSECQHMGIKVLPPNINESYDEFAIVPGKNQIRFALTAVKGVGKSAIDEVIETRNNDGKFESLEDFGKRVNATKFNKKAWESLIKTGAFDDFGDRSDLLFNLDKIQAYGQKIQKDVASGQTDLFSMFGANDTTTMEQPKIDIVKAPAKHTDKERLVWERELLGLYISSHPLDGYETYFAEQTISYESLTPDMDNQQVSIGGIISSIKTFITKSGSKMAFMQLENKTNELEVIVFASVYEKLGDQLVQDAIVKVDGKVNARDRNGRPSDEVKLVADSILILTPEDLNNYKSTGKTMEAPKPTRSRRSSSSYRSSAANSAPAESVVMEIRPVAEVSKRKMFVHIKNPDDHEILQMLKRYCSEYPGLGDVILVLGDDNNKRAMKMPFKVDSSSDVVPKLAALVGDDCVILK